MILDVWLEAADKPIGFLARDDRANLSFAYDDSWLARAGAYPLSLSLPLREEPFGDVVTRAFFDNLLQENDQLDAVMRHEGIARGDVAGLLAHVGKDCAGAVSVLPAGSPPVKRPGDLTLDYDPFDDALFEQLVRGLAEGRALPIELRDPSPVAGYRRKFSLAILPDGRFGIPKAGTGAPTTHILKIPDSDHRHEERDEAFVTLLAARCGFDVGRNSATHVAGHHCLLITRFDRVIADNKVYRIHQEDFAQASGLPAGLKYERGGREGRRFDAATIGNILKQTARPALAVEHFLRTTLFNFLIGNNDNHAKNHALLHGVAPAPILAPLYDLVPVETVLGFTDELAFHIGTARRAGDVTRDDVLLFAQALGIPAKSAPGILKRVASELIERVEEQAATFPADMKALDDLIGERAAQLNAILDLGLTLRARDAAIRTGGGWVMS